MWSVWNCNVKCIGKCMKCMKVYGKECEVYESVWEYIVKCMKCMKAYRKVYESVS